MKLAIISHTKHFLSSNEEIVAWEPTVRELNFLIQEFDEIVHLAPLHNTAAPLSVLPYSSPKIRFIPLKHAGGGTLKEKIRILLLMPYNLFVINKALRNVDIIQFRAPTNLGTYVLPFLSFFNKKPRWVKYAGNWNQYSPPLSYRFQRWWLRNNFQNSKVTINGRWPSQKKHLISFENPCISNSELEEAKQISKSKNFNEKLSICFVGRVEKAKGVGRLLRALTVDNLLDKIKCVYIIGDGVDRVYFENSARKNSDKIVFTGSLSRESINEFYAKSHIFCLPSTASEGFPKVIAEAAAYGCVPVVSRISSIDQYVDESNGYILDKVSGIHIAEVFNKILEDRHLLRRKAEKVIELAEKFTFNHYNFRIVNEIIINDEKE